MQKYDLCEHHLFLAEVSQAWRPNQVSEWRELTHLVSRLAPETDSAYKSEFQF